VIFELADAIEADQDVPVAIAELFGAFNVSLDESSGEELLIAVNCVENQGVSLETIQAQKDDVRPSLHSLASVIEDVLYPACLQWPPVPVPKDAFDYVSNADVPILLLSGRLDPRTPLSEAVGAREKLGNVTHVIVDHQGHSLATKAEGCLFRYGMNFLLNGEPAEELGCDATLNPPFFETVEDAVEAL
jgi:pimeloyl-ACP methyl ester carboxylesterase